MTYRFKYIYVIYHIILFYPSYLTYQYYNIKHHFISSRLQCTLTNKNTMTILTNNQINHSFSRMNRSISIADWLDKADYHASILEKLIYPPGDNMKTRMHSVDNHPIYNFLHSYYRYSVKDLKKYSPGLFVLLEDANKINHEQSLINRCMKYTTNGGYYDVNSTKHSPSNSRYHWINLSRTRDILKATVARQPFYGCFGLHEWAMLYSGNPSASMGNENQQRKRHQEQLSFRVSQSIIDDIVLTSGSLKCTHYDAYRFFHPDTQPLNIINPLSREKQVQYEQPGCIHATMDLFKYAYQIYPYISSELLIKSLELAIAARKIDMRASPYDVSHIEGCNIPICVETNEGRKQYIAEQEELYTSAVPIRDQLLEAYDNVLSIYATID